ncbi:MAG: hypothetical protein IH612_14800, partial [Desulfofustis sp.]|nr:hypothetical protein [Desulfofustis sp.]
GLTVILLLVVHLISVAGVFANGQRSGHEQQQRGHSNVLDIGPEVLDQLSEPERQWYRRFQEGVLFFDGWSAISEELLAIFPEEEWPSRQVMMQRIGVKIGTEWAKDNDTRKIDTEMIQEWGDLLRNAFSQGKEVTLATLNTIEREVDLILLSENRLSLTSRDEP